MKTIILLFICIFISFDSLAQEKQKNVFYSEVAGAGLFISANYERHVYLTDNLFIAPKVGLGWIVLGGSFPHALTLNYGLNHKLEVGVGGTYISGHFFNKFSKYLPHGILGYRYQKNNGFMFRATLTPFFITEDIYDESGITTQKETRILPWGGLSFGYNF
jgi:hypothetical protein